MLLLLLSFSYSISSSFSFSISSFPPPSKGRSVSWPLCGRDAANADVMLHSTALSDARPGRHQIRGQTSDGMPGQTKENSGKHQIICQPNKVCVTWVVLSFILLMMSSPFRLTIMTLWRWESENQKSGCLLDLKWQTNKKNSHLSCSDQSSCRVATHVNIHAIAQAFVSSVRSSLHFGAPFSHSELLQHHPCNLGVGHVIRHTQHSCNKQTQQTNNAEQVSK